MFLPDNGIIGTMRDVIDYVASPPIDREGFDRLVQ
jgi:hypothetical protein